MRRAGFTLYISAMNEDLLITPENAPTLFAQSGAEFYSCEFQGVNFANLPLKSTLLAECKFSGCNLANADLTNTSLRELEFTACNLMGINWARARRVSDLAFKDCKLDFGSFQGLSLKGLKCLGSFALETDFSDADLTGSDFSRTSLAGASFVRAKLEKADLRSAVHYLIDPRFTSIKGAKFSFPDVISLITALGAEVDL